MSGEPRAARRGSATSRVRRRRLIVGAVVVVVLVGAVVTLVVGTNRSGPPEPLVLPTPTPTVEPVERAVDTPFQQALPDVVLAFVVAEQSLDGPFLDAGAVEAYHVTYTDGDREVELRAGQWPTREEATERLEALVLAAGDPADPADPTGDPADPTGDPADPTGDSADPTESTRGPTESTRGPTADPAESTGDPGTPAPGAASPEPRDEPVLVDGTEAGRVVIRGDAAAATAVWTNGSTLFELTGPGEVVPAFYDAFPM